MFFSVQAEELIKKEMVTMLHYDAAYPVSGQSHLDNPAKHLAYLEQHKYEAFSQHDLDEVLFLFLLYHFYLRTLKFGNLCHESFNQAL